MRLNQGDADGALADFTALIGLAPGGETLAKAWNNRGLARQAKGDVAGSVSDFLEALRVAPADWSGRAQVEDNLADAREMLGGG
jgi:tetratricopeptide (TPR) repeat protein